MNGQNRQKTQPLANSFATVNLYLDTLQLGGSKRDGWGVY